jgi:ubiquitin conjugation factor E4 B
MRIFNLILMFRDDVFIRFVNMMMNDTRYLLDEGLTKLSEINTIQSEMESAGWESLTPQQKQEKLTTLTQSERQATSYMALASQTLETFNYVSKDIPEPFLMPEIIDRLAAMLDFNLSALVGPKCTELKVKNPDKYHFEPKKLLSNIVDVFLNLSESPEFARAVAKDGRSYRKEWFQKAAGAMLKTGAKSSFDIDRLAAFVDNVEIALKSEAQQEEELGDIPEEYLGTRIHLFRGLHRVLNYTIL